MQHWWCRHIQIIISFNLAGVVGFEWTSKGNEVCIVEHISQHYSDTSESHQILTLNKSLLCVIFGISLHEVGTPLHIWLCPNCMQTIPDDLQYLVFYTHLVYSGNAFFCRFLKKNMILGALWFSPEKPTMSSFLRPLIDAVNDLYVNGEYLHHGMSLSSCRLYATVNVMCIHLPYFLDYRRSLWTVAVQSVVLNKMNATKFVGRYAQRCVQMPIYNVEGDFSPKEFYNILTSHLCCMTGCCYWQLDGDAACSNCQPLSVITPQCLGSIVLGLAISQVCRQLTRRYLWHFWSNGGRHSVLIDTNKSGI